MTPCFINTPNRTNDWNNFCPNREQEEPIIEEEFSNEYIQNKDRKRKMVLKNITD